MLQDRRLQHRGGTSNRYIQEVVAQYYVLVQLTSPQRWLLLGADTLEDESNEQPCSCLLLEVTRKLGTPATRSSTSQSTGVDESGVYWASRALDYTRTPTAVLFRLMAQHGPATQANFLDVGFGQGAELIEAPRRGWKVFGLDVNHLAVENLRQKLVGAEVHQWCSGRPFSPNQTMTGTFSWIVARDTIYYFSREKLGGFFRESARFISIDGFLIVSFIEADLSVPAPAQSESVDFGGYASARLSAIASDNPIRFLEVGEPLSLADEAGFELVGRK